MKKFIVAAVLSVLSFAAFAQIAVSTGAGGYFAPYWFAGRTETPTAWTQNQAFYGFYGAKAFCDFTFISADVGILLNTGEETVTTSSSLGGSATSTVQLNQGVWLSIGAIGKYPFRSGSVKVYPLLGFEYDILLSMVDASGQDVKASMSASTLASLNRLWVKAGIGADIDVGGNFFFRPEADLCYKLPSSFDSEQIDIAKAAGNSATRTSIKVDIGFSIGYRY